MPAPSQTEYNRQLSGAGGEEQLWGWTSSLQDRTARQRAFPRGHRAPRQDKASLSALAVTSSLVAPGNLHHSQGSNRFAVTDTSEILFEL